MIKISKTANSVRRGAFNQVSGLTFQEKLSVMNGEIVAYRLRPAPSDGSTAWRIVVPRSTGTVIFWNPRVPDDQTLALLAEQTMEVTK